MSKLMSWSELSVEVNKIDTIESIRDLQHMLVSVNELFRQNVETYVNRECEGDDEYEQAEETFRHEFDVLIEVEECIRKRLDYMESQYVVTCEEIENVIRTAEEEGVFEEFECDIWEEDEEFVANINIEEEM